MNSHNFYSNVLNFFFFFWVYNQKKNLKTPSDGICLGEPLGDFCFVVHFWCCVSSFIFICQCSSFCCCIFIWFPGYFTRSPALHSGFSGLWRSSPALSSTLTTFDCLFFFIYRERYSFEWAFSTHRRYLTYAPSRNFGTTCFYQGFPGSRQLFLKIFRASYWSSRHRSGPFVCLIHSNPQFFIHLKFVFIHVNISKVLVVVKALIKNIDQQPHYSSAMKYKAAAKIFSSHKFWINCSLKNAFQNISLEYWIGKKNCVYRP